MRVWFGWIVGVLLNSVVTLIFVNFGLIQPIYVILLLVFLEQLPCSWVSGLIPHSRLIDASFVGGLWVLTHCVLMFINSISIICFLMTVVSLVTAVIYSIIFYLCFFFFIIVRIRFLKNLFEIYKR